MNGEKLASFYADVQVVFNLDEQIGRIQAQLREFATRIGPVVVPIKFVGVNPAAFEIAQMSAFDAAAIGAASSGPRKKMSESQWEAAQTASMMRQGYKQGEGGWYKEKQGAALGAGASGMGSMFGFAKANAAFFAGFAAIGDIVKGAHLDQQLAVLHAVIPAQDQYNAAVQQLIQTANLTGTNVNDTVHGFIAFSNAAKNAGVDMATASQSFKALNVAIAATGSNQQAYRIYTDFLSQIMNVDKVSLAKVSKTDLGRYLDITKLLGNLPQFKGMDEKQMGDDFNKLTKAQQMNMISTVLLTAYQDQASVAQNTLAGRFNQLQNSLELLGGTIATIVTPPLKLLVDFLKLFADSLNYDLGLVVNGYEQLKGLVGKGYGAASGRVESGVEGVKNMFHHISQSGWFNPRAFNGQGQTQQPIIEIHNYTGGPVKASQRMANPNSGKTFARSY